MVFKKQFKDPIYGYIEIDGQIVTEIIDTPAFQRLKDIRQTSYTPLYPAAYHIGTSIPWASIIWAVLHFRQSSLN